MEWAMLADSDLTSWAAIITAVGAVFIGVLTLMLQFFMNLRAQDKAEAKAAADAVAAVAQEKKLDAINEVAVATEKLSNSNFKRMQEEAAESRKALETANGEISKANKEIANLVKTLALQSNANPPTPAPTPAPVATPGLIVEGEVHDLVISNKPAEPTEEKKP